MFLLDAASPMESFVDELTHGPGLAILAAIILAGLGLVAFLIYGRGKKK